MRVFTDTYSVGVILLQLLFLARGEDNETGAMPTDPPAGSWGNNGFMDIKTCGRMQSLRGKGKFNLSLSDDKLRENFEEFLNMYLPYIHLEENTADEKRSPTEHLQRVLQRALAFGRRNGKGELVFDEENERYHTATEMLNELNAIRLELFYRQAKKLLETEEYPTYEQHKQRLEMAMRWDSHEDKVAWNLFGKKLFELHDEEAAYACFSEAIRIAEQSGKTFPQAYRNRAKLCRVVALETTSAPKASLYSERAKTDKIRAKEAEERLQPMQASAPPPTDASSNLSSENE